MAYFKQYKLLPFKLTQHHGATSTTKVLHRGEETSNKIVPDLSGSRSSEAQFDERIHLFNVEDNLPTGMTEPKCHELQRKAAIKWWEKLRAKFVEVVTECSAMPLAQICLFCSTPAEFRCKACGPFTFYCCNCLKVYHQKTNFFHVAEKWEASILYDTHQSLISPSPPSPSFPLPILAWIFAWCQTPLRNDNLQNSVQ